MSDVDTITFNWDFPEPEPFYGEGDYVFAHNVNDWVRPWNCKVVPSFEQETFDNGMDHLLYRGLPIALFLLIIYVVSLYG